MNNIRKFYLRSEDDKEDRASTGWLMKWKIGDYWIKSSGYTVNYTWESVAEALASTIAKDLNLEYCIEYKLCIINVDGVNLIGCISKDYNKPGLLELKVQRMVESSYLNRKNYFGESGYNQLIKEIKELFDIDIRKYLENTILIDSIILNSDRNLWNISIMLDKKTAQGHIAPIYDFGNSLGLASGKSGSFYDEYKYSSGLRARPFDINFENQLKYIRNTREFKGELTKTKELLSILYNEFTVNNNRYNVANPLTEDMLKYVYQVITKRYNSIIINKLWKD